MNIKNTFSHLVGEGVRHNEAGVTHGTTKVDESALGQYDNVASTLHGVSVNLGLDVNLKKRSQLAEFLNTKYPVQKINSWAISIF